MVTILQCCIKPAATFLVDYLSGPTVSPGGSADGLGQCSTRYARWRRLRYSAAFLTTDFGARCSFWRLIASKTAAYVGRGI
jgi:hypothetical protein